MTPYEDGANGVDDDFSSETAQNVFDNEPEIPVVPEKELQNAQGPGATQDGTFSQIEQVNHYFKQPTFPFLLHNSQIA